MILFNLLPYREALRLKQRQDFFASILLAALIGGLIAVPSNLFLNYLLKEENAKSQLLKQEIAELDKKIGEVADFELEISALESRRKSVENLQSERNLPVQVLSELTRLLPEGAYLTSMTQEGAKLRLVGIAQSNQRVSELLKNFETKGEWVGLPELVEIVALGNDSNSSNQPTTVQFTMLVKNKSKGAAHSGDAGSVGSR